MIETWEAAGSSATDGFWNATKKMIFVVNWDRNVGVVETDPDSDVVMIFCPDAELGGFHVHSSPEVKLLLPESQTPEIFPPTFFLDSFHEAGGTRKINVIVLNCCISFRRSTVPPDETSFLFHFTPFVCLCSNTKCELCQRIPAPQSIRQLLNLCFHWLSLSRLFVHQQGWSCYCCHPQLYSVPTGVRWREESLSKCKTNVWTNTLDFSSIYI